MSLASALTEPLASSRPVKVLERSLEEGRLAHAILLHGENLEALESVALALAGVLLEAPGRAAQHPDFFSLRPSHKARFIRIEGTRELIRNIQHSSHQGGRKVALVYEVDRMNPSAANAFLKTLEEPPADTTILLVTARPYDLLDTIRSRCFNFRLPSELDRIRHEPWENWLTDYRSWLGRLLRGPRTGGEKADMVMTVYGLISRFRLILKDFTDEAWAKEKEGLPEGLTDEEADALEAGLRKGIRQRLFGEIEAHTRQFALKDCAGESTLPARQLTHSIAELEHAVGLLEVNLNENVALESFLLGSLRTWTAR